MGQLFAGLALKWVRLMVGRVLGGSALWCVGYLRVRLMLSLAFGGFSLWWVRYLVGHVSGESSIWWVRYRVFFFTGTPPLKS